MRNIVQRYCPVSESLDESLKQMKAIRKWKNAKEDMERIKKRTSRR